MNKWIEVGIIFSAGVGIGVSGTYFALKKKLKEKYDEKLSEEILKVREIYSKDSKEQKTVKEPVAPEEAPDVSYGRPTEMFDAVEKTVTFDNIEDVLKGKSEYKYLAQKYGKEDTEVTRPEKEEKRDVDVYIIAPEEFDENDDYDSFYMTLFSDGIMADDCFEKVEDPERLLGDDWKPYLEEATAAYFRNEDIRSDIEVVRDLRTFEEAAAFRSRYTEHE